jgi:hypothetical protein
MMCVVRCMVCVVRCMLCVVRCMMCVVRCMLCVVSEGQLLRHLTIFNLPMKIDKPVFRIIHLHVQ